MFDFGALSIEHDEAASRLNRKQSYNWLEMPPPHSEVGFQSQLTLLRHISVEGRELGTMP